MNPQFQDEVAVNPFDLWEGANFKLKIRRVEGYQNYDKSEFEDPSALFEDDAKLEEVWKSEHSLQTFLDPKNFKTYDELKLKLNQVLNLNTRSSEPEAEAPAAGRVKEAAVTKAVESAPWNSEDADEDDDESYFAKLRAIAEKD